MFNESCKRGRWSDHFIEVIVFRSALFFSSSNSDATSFSIITVGIILILSEVSFSCNIYLISFVISSMDLFYYLALQILFILIFVALSASLLICLMFVILLILGAILTSLFSALLCLKQLELLLLTLSCIMFLIFLMFLII